MCHLQARHLVQTWLLVKKPLPGAMCGGEGAHREAQPRVYGPRWQPLMGVMQEPPLPHPHERPVGKNGRQQVAAVGCEHGLQGTRGTASGALVG